MIRFKVVRVIEQDISSALVSDIDYSAANSIRKSKNAKRITKETSNQTIVLHLTKFFEYYYEEEKISSMCKLEDLVNINILQSMCKLIIEGKQEEFDRLLQKSLSPEKVNNKFISLGGWQLDISGTIYKKANPVEVIEGWQFLLDKNIPIDVYTKAFLITC